MLRQCWIVPTPDTLNLEVSMGKKPGFADTYYTITRSEWENQGGE